MGVYIRQHLPTCSLKTNAFLFYVNYAFNNIDFKRGKEENDL